MLHADCGGGRECYLGVSSLDIAAMYRLRLRPVEAIYVRWCASVWQSASRLFDIQVGTCLNSK